MLWLCTACASKQTGTGATFSPFTWPFPLLTPSTGMSSETPSLATTGRLLSLCIVLFSCRLQLRLSFLAGYVIISIERRPNQASKPGAGLRGHCDVFLSTVDVITSSVHMEICSSWSLMSWILYISPFNDEHDVTSVCFFHFGTLEHKGKTTFVHKLRNNQQRHVSLRAHNM